MSECLTLNLSNLIFLLLMFITYLTIKIENPQSNVCCKSRYDTLASFAILEMIA